MKSHLLFLLLLIPLSVISGNKIPIVINYENGIYAGYNYSQIQIVEEDFNKDKSRYEGRLLEHFLENSNKIVYFPSEIDDPKQVLMIDIILVTSKGNVTANVSYGEQNVTLKGKGGTFGTFLNLFGDGMENLGKEIAKWLN